MRFIKHAAIVAAALLLTLGIPFVRTDYFRAFVSGAETDAVSSASVIIDQPSGSYVVLINTDKHTDEENLALWHDFFEGREVSFIFEDISCRTLTGDVNGLTMAESYMSRLPENQMTVKSEDPTLLLSKAEYGKFDVIIMSQELAEHYSAETVYDRDNIDVIRVKGESE